jgi:AmmeMemoRadiSam system protein A
MTPLTEDSRKSLLRMARAAIARAIGAPKPDAPIASTSAAGAATADKPDTPYFLAGAFVTLHLNGELRGCIGYPEDDLPLIDVVDRCAVSAAISDPRFPALALDEWNEVDIEISVLGPIERVSQIAEVVVGRHGLIVELGHRRGLLLPQVASERNWSAVEFASQTSAKAGLPRDAWRTGASLYKFEAEVFGETGS